MKFKRDHFGLEGKLLFSGFEDQKILFWVLLQICNQCFNTYITKDVYLHFFEHWFSSAIVEPHSVGFGR